MKNEEKSRREIKTKMASLYCDLHLWTTREDVVVRDTDLGCFKYYDKTQYKASLDRLYSQDKMSYAQGRGQLWMLEGKRLKGSVKELEELFAEQPVIFNAWRSSTFLQLMFASGLIANVHLNKMGDLDKITYDKFLVGRLLDFITDVQFNQKLIIVTYLESRVTLVTFGKPGNSVFENIAQCEPKVHLLDLLGPPGRRLSRKVLLSHDSSQCLFWWSLSGQEVFPWAPHLKEEDRANVMLYSFKGNIGEPKRMGYARTHSDPILFRFLADGSVRYLGQETTRRGEVQVETAIFSHVDGDRQLRRSHSNRLGLTSSVKCHTAVNDNLVIVGTTDGTLLLMDTNQHKLECQTKCSFIASMIKLHPDKAVIIVANEKGLMQTFDIALNPIKLQFAPEADHQTAGNVLDVGHYFQKSPAPLNEMLWCERKRKPGNALSEVPCPMETSAQNYLLLRFQGGPLGIMKVNGGVFGTSAGALGPQELTAQYLKTNSYHSVLLLLNQLDWSTQGETIVTAFNTTFHKLHRQPVFCRENEALMEMCLGLFYAPNKPIPDEILDEFSEQVHDITRKFFHRLIRHGQLTKAFRLAVDINDYDLFMDLHHMAARLALNDLAEAALIKARSVYASENVSSADSGSEEEEEEEDEDPSDNMNRLRVSSVPQPNTGFPLPGPMQLFSTTVGAQGLVLDAPLQPQINATFTKTTAAKRIPTNAYQTKAEVQSEMGLDSIAASLPKVMADQALANLEDPDDIKVIHFGVV